MAEVGETTPKETKEAPLAPVGSGIITPETDTTVTEKANIEKARRQREAERKIAALKRSRGEPA